MFVLKLSGMQYKASMLRTNIRTEAQWSNIQNIDCIYVMNQSQGMNFYWNQDFSGKGVVSFNNKSSRDWGHNRG